MDFSDIPGSSVIVRSYRDPLIDGMWNGVIRGICPDRFVTFNFNKPIGLKKAQSLIRYWHDKVDRKFLGPDYCVLQSHRSKGVVVFEHLQTNLHGHCALRTAIHSRPKSGSEIDKILIGDWVRVVKAGSLDVRRIDPNTLSEVLDYTKKEAWRQSFYEDLQVL